MATPIIQDRLLDQLCHNWGWIALRGVVAIGFGVLAFAWPGVTLVALALLWGAFAFADGVLALIAAFRIRDSGRPLWMLILIGILGIAAGVVAFVAPGMTALALLMFIAAWAIVVGVLQIIAAIRIRKEIEGEWMLILSGALAVIFGVLLISRPGAGAMAMIWVIAAFSIAFGVMLLILAFRLRGMLPRHEKATV